MKTINVEKLSKLYHIRDRAADSMRDAVTNFFRRSKPWERNDLWALRDVSFDVGDGETLGIIGHNGAGKSTLLKILSRITKPTHGTVSIRGRVGSLLEVGTGFHNELSGRENVYLNGAILGMKRAEINRKFDEIVAFSELEKFLDTPVKHYSSGMYMRLAFAIAAHFEPEVLIVDEVLAVGDASFQRKCLGKMDEISRSGRTVLFVSHNLGSLGQICNKGLLLHKGRLISYGGIEETIGNYLSFTETEKQFKLDEPGVERDMQITEVFVTNKKGAVRSEVQHDEEFFVEFNVKINRSRRGALFCIALLNKNKVRVFTEHKLVDDIIADGTGEAHVTYCIPKDLIAPNSYSFLLQIFLPDGNLIHDLPDVCPFTVIDTGSELSAYRDYGYVQIKGDWLVNG